MDVHRESNPKLRSVSTESKYEVAVIGLGYVGLPLLVTAAKSGLRCVGIDVSSALVDRLADGNSHIERVSSGELMALGERISFSTSLDLVADAESVFICVPTPLDELGNPDTSLVDAVVDSLIPFVREGQLVCLESTTYPGHTIQISQRISSGSRLQVGRQFHVCFSPEREDPGNSDWDTKTIPKVVGGVTSECTKCGRSVYGLFIDTIAEANSSTSAELCKLLENTQRLINIALINEFKVICQSLGENINHVIDLATTKPFGFTEYRPGIGIGGHCIPIDPYYLQWAFEEKGECSLMIEAARQADERNQSDVYKKIRSLILESNTAGNEVLCAGLTYKPNISDTRSSPAYELACRLNKEFEGVLFYDPLVSGDKVPELKLLKSLDNRKASIKLVIVLVDHDIFKDSEINMLGNLLITASSRLAEHRPQSEVIFI